MLLSNPSPKVGESCTSRRYPLPSFRMIMLLLALAGCSRTPGEVPDMCTVVMPDDIGFAMDPGFLLVNDGVAGLAVGNLGTYDIETCGTPQVEILSGWSGAYVFPKEAISVLTEFDEVCSSTPDDAACNGYFDPTTGAYTELAEDYVDVEPSYLRTSADRDGNLSIYVLVDSVPVSEDGSLMPISIYASTGLDSDSWTLRPIVDQTE